MPKNKNKKAFSIIEIIVAIGIFSIMASGVLTLTLGSLQGTVVNAKRVQAKFLEEEGMDAVRSIRDNDWMALTNGNHGLDDSSGSWVFSGTSDTVGAHTRTITIADVERDGNGDIVASGGTVDPRTKLATVEVSWTDVAGQTRREETNAYLTDWNVYDALDTTDSHWNDGTYSGTEVAATGEPSLVQLSSGSGWSSLSGQFVTHTTDTDFNAGTHNDTETVGTGDSANVELVSSQGSVSWKSFSSPVSNLLYDADALTSTDAWASGTSGKILHWDGADWTQFTDMGSSSIRAIETITANDVWAAGYSGKFYHYNGSTWTQTQDTGSTTFWTIDHVASNDVWAAGSSGKIYRYNGSSWSQFQDTGSTTWYGIHMLSANDGFVVGSGGAIRRFNGSSWNTVSSPVSLDIYGIHMLSASDGWAVGNGDRILRWNGSSWSQFDDLGGGATNAVEMVATDDVWAAGDSGRIFHYDGTSWSLHTDTGSHNWYGIAFAGAESGWVVSTAGNIYGLTGGTTYSSPGTFTSSIIDSGDTDTEWSSASWTETLPANTNITIAVRTGPTATPDGNWDSWSSEMTDSAGETLSVSDNRYAQYRATLTTSDTSTTPQLHDITVSYNQATDKDLYGVHFLNSNDGWAVGENGVFLHWDGSGWTQEYYTGDQNINDVHMVASNDVWAVAKNEKFYHYNGTTWSEFADLGDNDLYGIHMVSATDGWASGESGKIYRYNGSTWSEYTDLGDDKHLDIHMVSASNGWVTAGQEGSYGYFYQFDGATWNLVKVRSSEIFTGLHFSGASNGWAVAKEGAVFHYNGTSWSEHAGCSSSDNCEKDVHAVNSSNAWAVGEKGKIDYYNGTSWTEQLDTDDKNFEAIHMISTGDGWAVGESGTIYRYLAGYLNSGTYTSEVLDTDSATSTYERIYWDENLPADTDITIATRSGPTATPDGSWSSWSTELTNSSQDALTSPDNRYFQYRATLTTSNGLNSPQLNSARVTYKP